MKTHVVIMTYYHNHGHYYGELHIEKTEGLREIRFPDWVEPNLNLQRWFYDINIDDTLEFTVKQPKKETDPSSFELEVDVETMK